MQTKYSNQKGFTIVELLISMAAFSGMVLIASLTILQIGKMYYKGVNSINTQETSRNAISEASETAQFVAGSITNGSSVKGDVNDPNLNTIIQSTCVGQVRFSFVKDFRLSDNIAGVNKSSKQIRHVLWKDTVDNGCDPADITLDQPSANGRELLGSNMMLADFKIDQPLLSSSAVNINIKVIYGDIDLIEYSGTTPKGCKGGFTGAQWCASSGLSTQVSRRIKSSE